MLKNPFTSGLFLCCLTSALPACSTVDDSKILAEHMAKKATADAGKPDSADSQAGKKRATGGTAAVGGSGGSSSSPKAMQGKGNLEAGAGGSSNRDSSSRADAGGDREQASAGDGSTSEARTPTAAEVKHDQAGYAALIDWAALPTFADVVPQIFTTHERGEGQMFQLVDPGNKDFNSFLAICGQLPMLIDQQNDMQPPCQPGETGYLVAADDGAGYVSRILLSRGVSDPTSSVLVNVRPTEERIRIYLDGAAMPTFEGTWADWASAMTRPFDAPLTGWTSGGLTSYLPISYSKQLRVFVDKLAGSPVLNYIQVDTQRVQETKSFDAHALASEDGHAALAAMLDRAQGKGDAWLDQQVVMDGDGTYTPWMREQAGTLQRLEITLAKDGASETLKETSLRLSWDGDEPAIDMPLEAIFGARQALAPLSTLPMVVEVKDNEVHLILTLPMPFARSAKLELVHAAQNKRSLALRLLGTDELPRGVWGRLHTSLAQQTAPMAGERFRVAALSGRGKYLGTLLYAKGKSDNSRNIAASELGFLEGDERLEVDGHVVGMGTGTDNYFNGGFYFRDGLFNSPFAAVSQLADMGAQGTSEMTLLRWTILADALNFKRQFQLSFELGADRPATVREYAAVGFYYQ